MSVAQMSGWALRKAAAVLVALGLLGVFAGRGSAGLFALAGAASFAAGCVVERRRA